jgi:hypothetical protein
MKIFGAVILFSNLIFSQIPIWQVYTPENSGLPDRILRGLAVDQDDIKWIFSDTSIIKFDWVNWELFNSDNSIIPENSGFMTISKSGDGNVYAGGFQWNYDTIPSIIGMIRLSSTEPWIIYNAQNSQLAYNGVAGLQPSQDGGLLINSWPAPILSSPGTIQKFKDGEWFTYTPQTEAYMDEMEEDIYLSIWHPRGGPFGGVRKIQNNTLFLFTHSNTGFGSGGAGSIESDKNGVVWMSWWSPYPDSSGLMKFDGTNWIKYIMGNSNLPSNQISHLIIDSLGRLWMSGNGLIKFDGFSFTHYTPSNSGLYSTNIIDIQVDSYNNLWIVHPDAISLFNENGITTPVELISFNVEAVNNNVHLNWITVTETNNSGFEIQKYKGESSKDKVKNEDWEVTGFIEGNGTTTEKQFYSFVDENVKPGKYSYRLKQIDYDGSHEYSKVIEVEIGIPKEFSLSQNYPNPFNPTTKIKFSIPTPLLNKERGRGEVVTLKVYDVLGNEVATLVNEVKSPGEYEVEFDGSKLSSGIYFYQIKSADPESSSGQAFIQTKKMILLR